MSQKTLNFLVQPSENLQGALDIPGDKSISHRCVMLSALASGESIIDGFLYSEDCMNTLHAFCKLGVSYQIEQNNRLRVKGVGLRGLRKANTTLDLGNSGTSMRLLTGLLAGQTFDSTLTGDASLLSRPMGRVIDPLQLMGASIKATQGHAPLKILGGQHLRGITYPMPIASAQVKSCLLLAGLYAQGETTIIEPGITRDHTERMLKTFNYPIVTQPKQVKIRGGGSLQGTHLDIPSDLSSAAFFLVGAILGRGSDLTIPNVGVNPTRLGIIKILELMGAKIEMTHQANMGHEPVANLHIRSASLKGIEVPSELVPSAIDEFPILCIAAACAQGTTIIRDAKELRVKESDRIDAMVTGLNRLGIKAQALSDGAIIPGGPIGGDSIDSRGDHRVAMAFAMAAVRAKNSIMIVNCANVATSFPTFVSQANQVGLKIQEAKHV